jgi:DsbC/DsbD-like thiol-disulfide interchange protein
MHPIHLVSLMLSLSLVTDVVAGDLATPWAGNNPSHSRIILQDENYTAAEANRVGVQIELSEGWWTYWRAPGSSGIPPQFDWSGSENLVETPELSWPVPLRAVAFGESLNLYRHQVVFPVSFRAANQKKPVKLKLRLSYGVCRNVCVPVVAEHEIKIAPATTQGTRTSEPNARLISAYTGRQPSDDPASAGLEIREVWERMSGNRLNIGVRVSGLLPTRKPLVLVEGPGTFQASEIIPRLNPDRRTSTLLIAVGKSNDIRRLSGKRIRLTVIDGTRALEQTWVVGAQGSSASGLGLTPISVRSGDNPQP